MVGVEVDLREGLVMSEPAGEPCAAKDDTTKGNAKEDVLLGSLGESKDPETFWNSKPLSPKWLYAKPSEGKTGLSAASELQARLDSIWTEILTSNEVCYNSSREGMVTVNDLETDAGDMTLTEMEHGMLSRSSSEEIYSTSSAGCDASHEDVAGSLNEKYSTFVECKHKVNALTDGTDPGVMTPMVQKDDACYGMKVPGGNHTVSEQKVSERNLVNGDGHMGHSAFSENTDSRDINSAADFDVFTKLPDDLNSLFDKPFTPQISIMDWKPQNGNGEVKLLEQVIPPENLNLFYRDPQGKIQGPYSGADTISGFDQGYFGTDLPVCLTDTTEGTPFLQHGKEMPHLRSISQSVPAINPDGKSEALNAITDSMEASTLAGYFTVSVSMSDQQRTSSDIDGSLGRQVQRNFSYEDLVNSHAQLPLSNSENSVGILSDEQELIHRFALLDSKEMFHHGRPVSSMDNYTSKIANNSPMSCTPYGNQFLNKAMGESSLTHLNVPTDYDLNSLGLLRSELDGTHQKHLQSSNIITGIGDQGRIVNPVVGGDAYFLNRKQESFSSDSTVVPDSRSIGYRESNGSNVLDDAVVARQLSTSVPEFNQFSLKKHLLSQQLENQQLQQQRLLSRQHMRSNEPFLEQTGSSVLHKESINPSIPNLEHPRLQFQQKQQLHQLQQLQQKQQQLHHHPRQLMHQKQQKESQHQLLMGQLLHQPSHDPAFGKSDIDILMTDGMFDQVLYRQCMLRELQLQSHLLQEHHHPSVEQLIQAKFEHRNLVLEHHNGLLDVRSLPKHKEMLTSEDQLLGHQKDQLQAWQFSMASRHHPGMEEEGQVGRVWCVDEAGQFIRAAAGAPSTQSNKFSQLLHQTRSSFEQPSHLESNSLHEKMQEGIYEPNAQHFERSIPLSAEYSHLHKAGKACHKNLVNADIDKHVNSIGSSRRLASQRNSSAFDKLLFPDMDEMHSTCTMGYDASIERNGFSNVNGGSVSFNNYAGGVDNAYNEEMVTDKDTRFRQTPSWDAREASFVDMVKRTKKPADTCAGALDSDVGPGGTGRSSSKKKGRQIDPSLLGFKFPSNPYLDGRHLPPPR